MKTLCIYHGNCADGFTSAWIVRNALGADNVEFHAGVYGQEPPDVRGRDVIIVDFSYPYKTIVDMSFKADSILILDHHKSAAADLSGLPWAGRNLQDFISGCATQCYSQNMPHIGAVFDMDRSGAGITWDFFNPTTPRPGLVDIVEDRDLWRFALGGTREHMAAIFSYEYTFENWDMLNVASLASLYVEGKAIERKHHKDIAELLAVCQRLMFIGGRYVPVASLPYTMGSDAASVMAQGQPFAAYYYDTPNERFFGLRSTPDGMDVSEVAKSYGGGGHARAAGFKVPRYHNLAKA